MGLFGKFIEFITFGPILLFSFHKLFFSFLIKNLPWEELSLHTSVYGICVEYSNTFEPLCNKIFSIIFLPNIKFLNRSLYIDQRGFKCMRYNLQKVLHCCYLGCVCFGWKWFQEIIFTLFRVFGCHGKWYFPENDFRLTSIFTLTRKWFSPLIFSSKH